MKLSRLTLILGLAAALGLSVTAKPGNCHSSARTQSQPAEQSGSPSYQAAQSYDSYDCFYAGCHADYGDVLPELNADESNVSGEALSATASSEDADLPGDDPASRKIPADVVSTPSPLPSYGFVPADEVNASSPPRGYFAPGYPHPGYQHPGYGYSHVDSSKLYLNQDQSIQTEEELDIADLQEEPVPPEPEETAELIEEETAEAAVVESSPYGDDYDYGYGYGESYEYESEYDSYSDYEEYGADSAGDYDEYGQYDESDEYGKYESTDEYGEYVAEEPADSSHKDEEIADYDDYLDETVVEDESSIQDEYTHYDDIYGFGSEWYGPYDATKVEVKAEADSDSEPVAADEESVEEEVTASVEAIDPPIDEWLAESFPADAGPAELEVETADAEEFDEEDSASLNAAVKEAVDDWFYRETYGYGPRYDYDAFGYEDFPADSSPAQATTTRGPLAPVAASPEVESSFPWDYVYRLELGEIPDETASGVKIPFAAKKAEPELAEAEAGTVADKATSANSDPALPVSVDFDPAAWVSSTQSYLLSLREKSLLVEVQGLWTALTPMEIARTALAAAPEQKRQPRSVLVSPKNPVQKIEPNKQSMQSDVALRDLAMFLDDAGNALLMLSHRVEALANAAAPQDPLLPSAPLQSRVPADQELETR